MLRVRHVICRLVKQFAVPVEVRVNGLFESLISDGQAGSLLLPSIDLFRPAPLPKGPNEMLRGPQLQEPVMARKIGLTLMPLIAAVGLVVAPAYAGERQALVRHTDLDLSTEVGQAKFKQRVMRAVRNVCAFPSVKTLAQRQDQIQCEARAKTSAMQKAAQTIARHGGQVKVALD